MDNERTESDSAGLAPSSAAAFAALAHASRERVDAFLEEQTRLAREQSEVARLQADDIRRDDSLRHWSFIVRHISDVVKVTFEVALAIVVVAIVAGLASVVWTASHDDSLVIEAFSVPPDLAQRGLTGQAIAAQLQDKLAAMQAATNSGRPAKSFANSWDNGIKVMIPDTGISVGDLYRTLAGWLGDQTHITGEVYRTPTGIAITSRSNGAGGTTVSGSEADFDKLLQQSAEAIYGHTQPYRYAVYFASVGQMPRAMALYRALAANGDREDKLWAHMGISTSYELIDPLNAPAENREALNIEPDFVLAWQNIAAEELALGHPEQALAAERRAIDLFGSKGGQLSAAARAIARPANRGLGAAMTGDFETALQQYAIAQNLPDYANIAEDSRGRTACILALLHEPSASRHAWTGIAMPKAPSIGLFYAYPVKIEGDAALGDPSLVLGDAAVIDAAFAATVAVYPKLQAGSRTTLARQIWPFTALARAQLGDFKAAHALIDRTPGDCYLCVRMRGNIDALERNWSGSAVWFAKAVAQAPSIPFAYADWGAMLLHKGDLDGAIAKFGAAHSAGPHFADPLEMWGEALIATNRSDLALQKFSEAAQFAPNWGRLHLKWGEALLWLGRKADAAKQFALAANLDLTAAEKIQLQRLSHV
jgi:tetratricopeptide (TPR) repeat protein